jgi:phospholipid-binding lipoprotein MlaA
VFRMSLISAVTGASLLAAPALAQPRSGQAATATPAAGTEAANPDPWEPANRDLYRLNKGLDRAFLRPSATFYHHALPHPLREGVHNVLYNLGEPVTFLNNLLQARPAKAAATATRFAVNSTVGVLGVFDVTGAGGLEREPSGFAETLGRWGAPQGPYIYLPLFGPSSVRDLTGRVVDVATDPFSWADYQGRASLQTARTVAGGLDKRVEADESLKSVDRTATDPYATLRSAFLQSSSAKVNGADVKALPDFGPEPPGAPPAKPQPSPRQPPH